MEIRKVTQYRVVEVDVWSNAIKGDWFNLSDEGEQIEVGGMPDASYVELRTAHVTDCTLCGKKGIPAP
jgi:hypothetical protein